jgi:hypothetical protein
VGEGRQGLGREGRLKKLSPAFLLALACAATAAAHGTGAASGTKKMTLPAGEFHEECVELAARQKLDYFFRSAAPLDFNIHYHRDDKISYPVRKNGVMTLSASYSPRRADGYCLMWKNPRKKPVELDYRFSIMPKK